MKTFLINAGNGQKFVNRILKLWNSI